MRLDELKINEEYFILLPNDSFERAVYVGYSNQTRPKNPTTDKPIQLGIHAWFRVGDRFDPKLHKIKLDNLEDEVKHLTDE